LREPDELASAAKEIPGALCEKLVCGRIWPQFFGTTRQKVVLLTAGYGNCSAVGTVENELHVFHSSHSLYCWILFWRKEETMPSRKA
jgi:hypothetical protein